LKNNYNNLFYNIIETSAIIKKMYQKILDLELKMEIIINNQEEQKKEQCSNIGNDDKNFHEVKICLSFHQISK